MIQSLDIIIYTFLALIPGFIIDSLLRIRIPTPKRETSFFLYRILIFSALNYVWWIPKIRELILQYTSTPEIFSIQSLYWIGFIILGSPLLIGLFLCFSYRFAPFKKVMKRIGFDLDLTIPDAWDYGLTRHADPCYVIAVLNDDTTIFGYYGPNSYAASSETGRSIYLEKTYVLDGDTWSEPIEKSVLICSDQIKYLEFIERRDS